MDIEDYNIISLRQELSGCKTVDEGRTLLKGKIFEWSDDYSENLMESESVDKHTAFDAIVKLWLEWANYEVSKLQYKQATEVYESALEDPIVKQSYTIYKSNAQFCISRNKLAAAQKVYIKGLCNELQQDDVDKIWIDLVDFLRSKGKDATSTSLENLYNLINADTLKSDPTKICTPPSSFDESILRSNIPTTTATPTDSSNNSDHYDDSPRKSANVIALPSYLNKDIEWDDIKRITPEIIRNIHHNTPPMIFSAPHVAPMKDGLASLAADEVNELCRFLQISTLAELTNEGSTGRYCDRIVDILEGLWVVQGIKEKQYHAWKNELKESNQQEYYNITNTSANEIEQNKLLHKLSIEYEVQMEILCALINRTSYKLLMDQVRTLIQLSFPSINSNIVEKIELSISKSINSNNVNEFDQQLVAEISNISRRVTAILSTRIKSNSDYYSFEEKQKRRKQRK